MKPLLPALAALGVLAVAPAAATATQRHASPTGSGTACSAADPCQLSQALYDAHAGDEVVVDPGDYTFNVSPVVGNQLTIRGVAGRPRPRLLFEGGQSSMSVSQGTVLRHLEIVQTAPSAIGLLATGAELDQVVVQGSAGYSCTALVGGGTIRNSIFVGPGSVASVLCVMERASASSLRNVTAVATDGGGVAIEAMGDGATGKAAADLVNVIAKGGPGGAGLLMTTDSSGAEATISATNSNFANYWTSGANTHYVNGGGNQGIPPHFVDAAAGDYRQAPGSVTIGAGLDGSANGALDVDGDPRAIGRTDIGADEFVVAPTATTGTANAVTDRSATLGGSVNPRGAPTSYRFEYGTTSGYGATTGAIAAGAGEAAVASAAELDGLSPGTTYHFRLVASNAGGEVRGEDRTFTTAASTSPTTPPSTPGAGTPFAGVGLASTRLRLVDGRVAVKLACPAATAGGCTGRTKLRTRRAGTLGRAGFAIAAGEQAKLRIRVSRRVRALLRGSRRLRGKAVIVARSGAGELKTTVAAVTIRRG